jgi:cytochrome c553
LRLRLWGRRRFAQGAALANGCVVRSVSIGSGTALAIGQAIVLALAVAPSVARSENVTATSDQAVANSASAVPAWLYPINPPSAGAEPPHDETTLLHVPGSRVAFSQAQLTDLFKVPDWYPERHPPMPVVVSTGRKPSVYACGYCHLPDGGGRPENAPLAGLPARYIIDQVAAFRSGTRRSGGAGAYLPGEYMQTVAKNATVAEVAIAAAYFSSMRLRPRVEIVEVDRAPATHVEGWMFVPDRSGATVTLGERLIEVALDLKRHEMRDAATGYRAYVPLGSIARGRRLVGGGADAPASACVNCHGADLRGLGPAPPLAGRSPSYLLRQLVAFKSGLRQSESAQGMQPVIADLEMPAMVAICAYVAAQKP